MAGPLSKWPEGLNEFLGLKFGTYPRALAEFVQPTLDLSRFYADNQSVSAVFVGAGLVASASNVAFAIPSSAWLAVTGTVDLADGGAQTIVPQNEVWMVLEARMGWTMDDASHQADFNLLGRFPQTQSDLPITDSTILGYNAGIAGITRSGHRVMTVGPRFLLPGSTLVYQHCGIIRTAGTITPSGSIRIVRLRR